MKRLVLGLPKISWRQKPTVNPIVKNCWLVKKKSNKESFPLSTIQCSSLHLVPSVDETKTGVPGEKEIRFVECLSQASQSRWNVEWWIGSLATKAWLPVHSSKSTKNSDGFLTCGKRIGALSPAVRSLFSVSLSAVLSIWRFFIFNVICLIYKQFLLPTTFRF